MLVDGATVIAAGRKRTDFGYRLLAIPVEEPAQYVYGNPVLMLDAWATSRNVNLPYRYLDTVGRTWGCNHPTDPTLQDEDTIVAAANDWTAELTVAGKVAWPILLLGFSASGFASMSLLERHPDVFAGAIVFDCPLDEQDISVSPHWDMLTYFEDQDYFAANYRLTDLSRLGTLAGKNIALSFRADGTNEFLPQMIAFAGLLCSRHMNHTARFTDSSHRWDSGWVEDALDNFPVDY